METKLNLIERVDLKTIGSQELRDAVKTDLKDIFSLAKERNLHPRMLVVGSFFVKFSSLETVKGELNIHNWELAYTKDPHTLETIVNEKMMSIYRTCEEQDGKVAYDKNLAVDIYLNPDEDYMSLYCIDSSVKSTSKSHATKDGYPIVALYFNTWEILPEFITPTPDELIIQQLDREKIIAEFHSKDFIGFTIH